jgi:hypothetical protein
MIVLTQAAVLLAWLALLGKFPITAITLGLIIVAWPAVRFFGEFFFGGLAAGLGLRLSGFGQAERSRPGHHFLAVTLVCDRLRDALERLRARTVLSLRP